jgi:molecular chaperone DnaK
VLSVSNLHATVDGKPILKGLTLDVPAGRPKGCEIAVTFSYDENQRVRALVVDKQSGRSKEVAVSYKGAGVLSPEELKRRSAHLRAMRIE